MRKESSGESALEATTVSVNKTTLWQLGFFLLVFFVLQFSYGAAKGSWIERMIIDHMTVASAAWLINAFDPELGVEPIGSSLRAPGGGINVLNGCEGTDVVFLLVAAMLVAPIAWRARLKGFLIGTTLILLLNQIRVIGLFYAFRSDRGLFNTLHGVVSPLLLIIAAAGFFILWLQRHAHAGNTRQ